MGANRMVQQLKKIKYGKRFATGLALFSLLSIVHCSHLIVPDRTTCTTDTDNRIAVCRGRGLAHVPMEALHPSLEELDLSYNSLQVIRNNQFAQFHHLRVLKLQYNNISLIEDDAFLSNPLLESLNLFNNSLRAIPFKALKPLSKLQSLEMSNNLYTEATLAHDFSNFSQLKVLSMGGPLVLSLKNRDFWALQNISLEKFAIKTSSSLKLYESGCLKVIRTQNMWFDVALDENAGALPLMLQDLANKTFSVLRFRNLFEFKYYPGDDDLFEGLKDIQSHKLVFHRGKFNEKLLRMALLNLQVSPIKSLELLFIDFARSPTFVDNGLASSVTNLALDDLILCDISNPDILRFDWRFTWFSKVRRLSIQNVNFNFVPCDAWDEMRTVEVLDVSNNRLQDRYLYNKQCDYSGRMLVLHTFNISNNQLNSISELFALAGEFRQLQVIDLSYNQFRSMAGTCNWKQNLTRVILQHNNLVSSDLSCLPKTVQYLDLSYCSLDQLDMLYFQQATNLIELLLNDNKIKFIPSDWSNPTLKSLSLDGNSFGLISMDSFKEMPSLTWLKAGNNPYHCTCDLHNFIQQTTTKGKVNITDWPYNYRCYHPEGLLNMVMLKFFPSRVACDIRLVIIISVSTTAAVALTVMLVCYVFNVPWYAKATYQIIRAKYRAHQERGGFSQVYAYHAFISYSHSDADWVRDQLLTYLEGSKPPYRLCIHERDFMPGKWIIDNIIENIESSRKIIFVLSRHFVNSEWCNYELYFAQQRAIGKTFSDVILVVMEPIDPESLPHKYCKLKKMLNTKTYLEWPKETKQQAFFWAQLKSTLGKPILTRDRATSSRSRLSSMGAVSMAELTVDDVSQPAVLPNKVNRAIALQEVNLEDDSLSVNNTETGIDRPVPTELA